MVLELLAIGGAVIYYVKKNKENKAKKATFAAGQPWMHDDRSVTYPPGYPGLPGLPAYTAEPHGQHHQGQHGQQWQGQQGQQGQQWQGQGQRSAPDYYYSDAAAATTRGNEKSPLVVKSG